MTEIEQNQLAQLAQSLRNPTFNGLMQALTAAYALGRAAATSDARKAASRVNGATPVKPGSRPRGRPAGSGKKQQEVRP